MSDHRTPPPRSRRGNGPEVRATRGNLSALAAAEQQQREHELELARASAPVSSDGKRETALLAASSAWAGMSAAKDRDKSILETADKFLAWLES